MSVETDVSQGTTPEPSVGWGERLALALLRLVVIVIVGALLGLLVGGVGGRLAMMLLAILTPEATGLTSDDGFVMGQFTASGTLSLLAAGTFLGAVGGVLYALLRGLMIGPRWFQVLSIGVGPAVVVGSMLVQTDGVDFRLLQPAWLAIGLFVAIPGVYAALLTLVAERLLRAVGLLSMPRLVAGEMARRRKPSRQCSGLHGSAWPWCSPPGCWTWRRTPPSSSERDQAWSAAFRLTSMSGLLICSIAAMARCDRPWSGSLSSSKSALGSPSLRATNSTPSSSRLTVVPSGQVVPTSKARGSRSRSWG